MQAGKKVKLVECLPGKHGDLNLISRTHIKKHKTKQQKLVRGKCCNTVLIQHSGGRSKLVSVKLRPV